MKKCLILAILPLLLMPLIASGQGAIDWGTSFPSTAYIPVFGLEPSNWYLSQSGASTVPNAKPTGTTVYGGPLLTGTGYTFAVLAGPDASHLSVIATTTFRTSTATANVLPKGLVFGGTATVAGVAAGVSGFYQIAVWNNEGGTLTNYATAESLWQQDLGIDMGWSQIVPTGPLGGLDPGTGKTFPNPSTSGWSSFNTYYWSPGQPKMLNPTWTGNSFSVQVQTFRGYLYWLEFKQSLSSDDLWSTAAGTAGNGGIMTLTDPAANAPGRFYRIHLQ